MGHMADKTATDLAYDAGQAMLTEPSDRRSVDACPFAVGTDEREAWLRGFSDALNVQDDLRSALAEAQNA